MPPICALLCNEFPPMPCTPSFIVHTPYMPPPSVCILPPLVVPPTSLPVALCAPWLACALPLVYALLICACPPYLCTLLQYIYHKVVSRFTTWASKPSTTERRVTAGYLGGDHTFYTHSHKYVHGWGCIHVRSHAVDLFIVIAYYVGGHIKLLVSL
jgi:hypothetical protein